MELDDKALIDKYLHGELSDPDQESLEERFFVEEDLFEQIETYEMRLIDRFVRGEMDAGQRSRFETGYLTSPERQKKVAKESLFHKELGKLKGERRGWLSGLSSLFEIRMPALQFAGVAALVLLSIGVFWTVLVFRTSPEDVAVVDPNGIDPPVNTVPKSPEPISPVTGNNVERGPQDKKKTPSPAPSASPAPQLDIPKTRVQPGQGPVLTNKLAGIVSATLEPAKTVGGAPRSVPVRISQKTVFLNLSLPLPAEIKGANFSVVVADKAGGRILTSGAMKPLGKEGSRVLSVNLPTEKLSNGVYDVTVTAKEVASESVRYRFDVKRED